MPSIYVKFLEKMLVDRSLAFCSLVVPLDVPSTSRRSFAYFTRGDDQLTGRVGWVNLHARDLFFRLIFVKIMKSKGGVNIEDESEWNLKKWIGEVEF